MTSTSGSLDTPLPSAAASVGRSFVDRIAATPDREAFRAPTPDGGWKSLTWRETGDDVYKLAAGLIALGIEPEQRVGIAADTSLEWILADLAVMCAGAATTTVYSSTGAEDVAYILGDSNTRILFAENDAQVAKVQAHRDALPDLRKVVLIKGEGDGDFVITMDDLRTLGKEHLAANPKAVEDRILASRPEHLATLIYTSGTTGKPKGVELPHRCWTYEGAAMAGLGILRSDDLQYLWLPLAHSFGKVLLAGQLQVGFATAVDGRVPQIIKNLPEIQPTFMAGVPRIFEKIYAAVGSAAVADGGAKAKIFTWAFETGKQARRQERETGSLSPVMSAKLSVAEKLVFSKIKDRMGGRIRYFVSGSAALSGDIAEWFDAAGMTILEGYGLTETSAATCLVRPDKVRFGTVGEPLPGTVVRIAEDGEILVKGAGVMRGYHNMTEQTAEVMLADGWFATGDIGEIDSEGRIRITDRKKDLVKTSGGKYIAPGAIESQFKSLTGLASNIVVHANNRNFVSALVTLDPDALKKFGAENGLSGDYAADSQSDAVRAELQKAFDTLNSKLNKWETVKQFRVLPNDLSVEAGEITPSLKVKRKVVEEKYVDVLDSMYTK